MLQRLKRWARALKNDGMTLWFCCRHPDMPRLPKILALLVVGYFLSPIDLIPDFIPVLGYLDELLLLPVCIYLIMKLVPAPVLAAARESAAAWAAGHGKKPRVVAAAFVIVLLWVLLFWGLWLAWGDALLQWFTTRAAG
jgi:uncharacterized membrane protein YkvA (DUF1232 family)